MDRAEGGALAIRPVSDCKIVDAVIRLHFTYLAQIDPEVAVEVVRRLRLQD